MKLVGVESLDERQKEDQAKGRRVYLWLNKGFVLLNGRQGVDGLSCAFAEMLGGSPEVKNIAPGDKAVYLHDGWYSLIVRK